MTKVLLVGGGGREDAICRKIVQSGAEVYAALGHENPSILKNAAKHVILKETDYSRIITFALENQVDIAFIGPDPVLATPLADELQKKDIPVASPSSSAARIETDKVFMRGVLERGNIPGNPKHHNFNSIDELKRGMNIFSGDFVVKPVGLTGGKGVRVMGDHFDFREQGISYAEELIQKDGRVLIEEKLVGEEFSLQVFCDGSHIAAMPLAQDYKRAYEGDTGPNTGGMGSITDSNHLLPFVTSTARDEAFETLKKVAATMRSEGYPFKGVIYGQFMITKDGLRLIEINARFADPEGINVLYLLEDDFVDILYHISEGSLSNKVKFKNDATVLKYVVPTGYGSAPQAGRLHIEPLTDRNAEIFYASVSGTMSDVAMSTSRALAIIARADSIPAASAIVDQSLKCVKGNFYSRRDIGTEQMLRKKTASMPV